MEKLGITAKSRLQYQHTPPASHTGGRERCEQAERSISTWPMEVREWAGMLGLSETCPGPWSTQPASAPKSNICGISYIQQVFAEHEDQRITLVLQIQQRTTQVKLSSLSALMRVGKRTTVPFAQFQRSQDSAHSPAQYPGPEQLHPSAAASPSHRCLFLGQDCQPELQSVPELLSLPHPTCFSHPGLSWESRGTLQQRTWQPLNAQTSELSPACQLPRPAARVVFLIKAHPKRSHCPHLLKAHS